MRIALIGAGNLATQLGVELTERGHQVMQVYSRTQKNALELAARLMCSFTDDLAEIEPDADLYIIAVADDAIEFILATVNFGDRLVIHTAGGVSMDIFNSYCKNFGVLYPLQTFSKEKRADFNEISLCIEANSGENLLVLNHFARSISEKVHIINSEQRLFIHLAAVFVCNFVNHFYLIGEQILKEKEIDFGILKPLIMETASKILIHSPGEVQTGPAVRNDINVIKKHMELLNNHPQWSELYRLISENIYLTHNH
jgi:predicted short-subunit dehydrogenase-like oxidoreductase (DUF2520 family)